MFSASHDCAVLLILIMMLVQRGHIFTFKCVMSDSLGGTGHCDSEMGILVVVEGIANVEI